MVNQGNTSDRNLQQPYRLVYQGNREDNLQQRTTQDSSIQDNTAPDGHQSASPSCKLPQRLIFNAQDHIPQPQKDQSHSSTPTVATDGKRDVASQRPTSERKPPSWHKDYVLNTTDI